MSQASFMFSLFIVIYNNAIYYVSLLATKFVLLQPFEELMALLDIF